MDEHELVRRCQNGDKRAMETIMRQYQQWVYNIAYGMLSNPEDCQRRGTGRFSVALGEYRTVSVQISVFDVALPDRYQPMSQSQRSTAEA